MTHDKDDAFFTFSAEGWPAVAGMLFTALSVGAVIVFFSECHLKEQRVQIEQMKACTTMCVHGVHKFNGNGCECK